MAIPADPSVTTIVTEGLKRGGRVAPSAAQITDATDHQLQEVKSDIMRVAATHPALQVFATVATTKGEQRYAWPTDMNIPLSITLLDGPDTWRGTAQAGAASTITLASAFSEDPDTVIGHYIVLTGGTGSGQYREVRNYVNTTKVVTVNSAWTTNPDATSTYLVISLHRKLWPLDKVTDHTVLQAPFLLGSPYQAANFGQEYYLYPVPDKSTYGVLYEYFIDISKLDEVGAVFVQLLREWRSLFIQGVAAYTMQRFDEDRAGPAYAMYNSILLELAGQVSTVSQARFHDV